MSFTDRKPFTVSPDDLKRPWGGGFHCKLCGVKFKEGDEIRWIYANGTAGMQTGNFFVCDKCDGDNAEVRERAKASFGLAVALAKQWDIYGPDWQRDMKKDWRR